MERQAEIAIIGGNSSIARLLLAGPLVGARSFIRGGEVSAGGAPVRRVARYHDIGAADLAGCAAVINCAGAVSGSEEELEEANVALPRALAAACREAGVPRLVHISSFSVYGDAERIGNVTPEIPRSAYGRSKLRGEAVLLEAGNGAFQPVIVRFPAILDPLRPRGKVALLLSAWRRMRVLPVPAREIRRSMISTAMVADVLAELARGNRSGVVLAADPVPFTYAMAEQAIRNGSGSRVHLARLPGFAFAPLQAAAPGLYASLFADSLLDPAANFASDQRSDLFDAIEAMVRGASK